MLNLTAIICRGVAGVCVTLAAVFLVSCAGSGGKKFSGSVSDGVSTPRHSLPRHEYPFDSNGQYKEEWAQEGERRKGWNSSRSYVDVDFSRDSSKKDAKKETKVASTSKVRSVPAKEKAKRSGGGFFASRQKKVEEPKPRKVSSPPPRTSSAPQEQLLASNTTDKSSWNRSRISSPVSSYQSPRRQSPVVQAEPRTEVRQAPSRKPAQTVQAPAPTPKPVIRPPEIKAKAKPKPKPKPTPPPPAPKRYHVVVKGDTLYNISVRYKSNIGSIKSRNRLSSDTIRLGQRLEIP